MPLRSWYGDPLPPSVPVGGRERAGSRTSGVDSGAGCVFQSLAQGYSSDIGTPNMQGCHPQLCKPQVCPTVQAQTTDARGAEWSWME